MDEDMREPVREGAARARGQGGLPDRRRGGAGPGSAGSCRGRARDTPHVLGTPGSGRALSSGGTAERWEEGSASALTGRSRTGTRQAGHGFSLPGGWDRTGQRPRRRPLPRAPAHGVGGTYGSPRRSLRAPVRVPAGTVSTPARGWPTRQVIPVLSPVRLGMSVTQRGRVGDRGASDRAPAVVETSAFRHRARRADT